MVRKYNDFHKSVMVEEILSYLITKKDGIYVDCTAGEGGHIKAILEFTNNKAKIIGVDVDYEVLEIAEQRLKDFSDNVVLIKSSYKDIDMVLRGLDIDKVDGFLMDLGVSTFQLKGENRGFTFTKDEPLDMRMDVQAKKNAAYIVNNYSQEELRRIIFEYGEEKRFAHSISKSIIKSRPINTTQELVNAIRKGLPSSVTHDRRRHFATKTFQALRIEVNEELKNIEETLAKFESFLTTGARVAVISFHSLEDRIVKDFFKNNERYDFLTPKPILPTQEEIKYNPRSRSAKLRVAEYVGV
ncbi:MULTISPECIES: 16S rRNA (cytosine(1402)-N(4))-methyltransferase RsmH [Petrotoga]|uniref:Ribosomal RNA small subunit methyltransferase H n=2 Tax=Petrotoga sibirica TaxID=156202 RepID=A0A855MP39_9BACT|nr:MULTISPECIES: 16S rRNA (cytosine(1402)-N(4))-methyltransferase RsmH [Petrotoga]POZ88728.1 16S rRNA methyltransferase [Petrotoga sibirica DSM 13575]POZ90851.1 16S rRNA methyltransferase [Petrotoga sp. SL27]